MNYYERIQNSICYIENNLDNELAIEDCARQAYMSVSGYYRMFLSIVGFNVKEYIRQRRLTLAMNDLLTQSERGILDVAVKYLYQSADSFTRAFKKQFGILPSRVQTLRQNIDLNKMERIDIMEKFFETENTEFAEKYPDIKVIRSMPDMKVACFTYFGPDPEGNAFEVMKKWTRQHQISLNSAAYRVFGYNHPDPSSVDNADELYGYEVCVTIPDSLFDTLADVPADFTSGTYDSVKRRILKGGKYAVMSVKKDENGDIGTNIMLAWKRFSKWMEEGKYIWGRNQYLEEHIGFDESDDHIGGVELYLSVDNAPAMPTTTEITMAPFRAAMFRADGNDRDALPDLCFTRAIAFAKQYGLDSATCRIFEYNKGFDMRPPFFHVVLLSLPDSFDETACEQSEVTFITFPGGKYLTAATDLEHLGATWLQIEKKLKETKTPLGTHQWIEEWHLDNFAFPAKAIIVNYPIG